MTVRAKYLFLVKYNFVYFIFLPIVLVAPIFQNFIYKKFANCNNFWNNLQNTITSHIKSKTKCIILITTKLYDTDKLCKNYQQVFSLVERLRRRDVHQMKKSWLDHRLRVNGCPQTYALHERCVVLYSKRIMKYHVTKQQQFKTTSLLNKFKTHLIFSFLTIRIIFQMNSTYIPDSLLSM